MGKWCNRCCDLTPVSPATPSIAASLVTMESWNHGFFFGYSTGMALSSLWLLNPENHYSAYKLAHVNTDSVEQGQLTSGQHGKPQSRDEIQSGTILCGKALFLSETWCSPSHFMCAMQTRVLKYPLFPLTWRSLLAHLLSACIVEVMSICLLCVWTKPLGKQNKFSGIFHAVYLPWLHNFLFLFWPLFDK